MAYAFCYGLDVLRENGLRPTVVGAGLANMFRSEVFTQAFANNTGLAVELHQTDGSIGAALGAGVGVAAYEGLTEACDHLRPQHTVVPNADMPVYEDGYQRWQQQLQIAIVGPATANGNFYSSIHLVPSL